jgi:eukaryotic-like serine/threonine-protein kinase
MPLASGDHLGPYEILTPIGKGGMGEVYRARDPRLNREVAVKISADRFTERFQREARAIASLNHPNICTLHDIGPNYLVMELVEGPTLAERIKQGPLPLDEALEIARQIAEALEAAHEKGITHRDLKPGNIKIKPDGTVKVLDFGLAKMGGTPTASSTDSPTLTMSQTQAGMILGTAAYMSPEQAKGKPVDHRADIYAFGVVLYEMVTGERLHTGETTTEVLASVIKEPPDWNKVPRQIRRLLQRCLEKDPQKRQRHIGDVMALVDEAGEAGQAPSVPAPAPAATAPSPPQQRLWPAVAGLFLVTTLAFGFLYLHKPQPAPAPQTRFQIPLPDKTDVSTFAISPDGRRLVFQAAGGAGTASQLWIRSLDSLESHPLPDTEGATFLPFWSPDSRSIAFMSGGKLKKIDASGGPAQTICDLGNNFLGGSWSRDGAILFGTGVGIMRVPAGGGTPSPVTSVNSSRGELAHLAPFFLPEGRHFVYFVYSARSGDSGVYAGSLDAQPKDQPHKQLVATGDTFAYAASPDSGNGQLLYLRDGTLVAQTLDTKRLDLTGEPIPVAEHVGSLGSAPVGLFTASNNGVLMYRVGGGGSGDISQLTWYDRQGKMLGVAGDPGPYTTAVLSPDATRAAVTRDGDIWVVDLMRGSSTRLTTTKTAVQTAGVWSPDGTHIAYTANPGGVLGIYQRASNGAGDAELLWKGPQQIAGPSHWSPDGRFLQFAVFDPKTGADMWLLGLKDRKAFPFLQSQFTEIGGRFSPDGRWLAYISNRSGTTEIYVRPFNPDATGATTSGGEFLVSKGGAAGMPRWRSDGKELYYLRPDGKIMAVDITTTPQFHAGEPKLLFQTTGFVRGGTPGALGDATPDGKRFLLAMPANRGSSQDAFTVVLNWTAALKK